MKRFKLFFRQFKYEFIAFIVNVISASLSILLTTPQVAFVIAVIIFTISMFTVIYFRTKDRDFYFMALDKPGDEKDWVGRGKFGYLRNEDCFEITDSHAGFIFPKTSTWDDYKFECKFKIANISLGCIVRAVNLSNYVMYQIFYDKIKPHLRINGEWIITEESTFDKKLKPDMWYQLTIICEKRGVRVVIRDEKKKLVDRHFSIPAQMGVVYREVDAGGKETKRETRLMQNIDFDFGSIGIRNHGEERALIKEMFVEKL